MADFSTPIRLGDSHHYEFSSKHSTVRKLPGPVGEILNISSKKARKLHESPESPFQPFDGDGGNGDDTDQSSQVEIEFSDDFHQEPWLALLHKIGTGKKYSNLAFH